MPTDKNPAVSASSAPTSTPIEGRKYVSFAHTFSDPWTLDENGDPAEVRCAFRFAKPSKVHIQRMQDKASKNASQASRNLLLDTVHPDDKDAFVDCMENYPGIATSLATAMLKGVGISAELGN